MRPPHAKITILALCGLAAAAGIGAAASPAVTGASQGPVAAYGFDEGRGVRVADASDNANNGTTSARRTDAGRFGRALRMDRPSEAAIVPDSASLRPSKALTLEAWVRPDRAGGSRVIVVKEGGSRVAYALNTTGGRPQAVVNSGSTAHVARAASPLKPGRWTHLTATYDGRTVRLLVGGVEVARTPATGRLLTARGPLRIGAGGTGGNRFLGRIDEVRVYGRALKHAEIVRDMHRAVRSDPAGGSTTPVIVKPSPRSGTPSSSRPRRRIAALRRRNAPVGIRRQLRFRRRAQRRPGRPRQAHPHGVRDRRQPRGHGARGGRRRGQGHGGPAPGRLRQPHAERQRGPEPRRVGPGLRPRRHLLGEPLRQGPRQPLHRVRQRDQLQLPGHRQPRRRVRPAVQGRLQRDPGGQPAPRPAGPGRRRQLRLRHLGQRHGTHASPIWATWSPAGPSTPTAPSAAGSPASTGSSRRRPPRAGRPASRSTSPSTAWPPTTAPP